MDCNSCGAEIKSKKAGTYCSNKCFGLMINRNLVAEAESGLKKVGHRTYRSYLINVHGPKCMKCGWSEINTSTGKVPIEMNHKDGDSENTVLSNVELLCPNCHSLTPNYKALNKGNGRFSRRERYAEGKSF